MYNSYIYHKYLVCSKKILNKQLFGQPQAPELGGVSNESIETERASTNCSVWCFKANFLNRLADESP